MIKQLWSEEKYTNDELNARLKFFIGIILGLTLFGIVFVVLYSLIFVTQPMNGMSPVDNKFFELIIPVATFLTGTLSGIMLAGNDKEAQKQALAAANKGWDRPPTPIAPTTGGSSNVGFGSTTSAGGFGSSPATGASSFSATISTPAGFGGGSFGGSPAATIDIGFGGKKVVPESPQPEI